MLASGNVYELYCRAVSCQLSALQVCFDLIKNSIMKRRILLLISILTISTFILSGQDSIRIKPWSISLSYAPRFEIYRPLNPTDLIYFKSFEVSINKKISQHLSIGLGINYQNMKKNDHALVFDGDGINKDLFYDFTYFDFPIQIDYHFFKNHKTFDPYLKASIINSFYHSFFEAIGIDYYFSDTYTKYFICLDLGIGGQLKIYKRLSLMCQASLGFGINHYNPQYTFFKSQIGLSYYLTKK